MPSQKTAGRYVIEFDGDGKFLMRPIDAAGQSKPGEFAGGDVLILCRMLADSLPACAVVKDHSEGAYAIVEGAQTWAEAVAVLNSKAGIRRAVGNQNRRLRAWALKYITRHDTGRQWVLTPLGESHDASTAAENAKWDARDAMLKRERMAKLEAKAPKPQDDASNSTTEGV